MTSYEALGVRRVINAMGAVTFLGGLPMSAGVRAAIDAAAMSKVDLFELQAAVGRRIAELTGAEHAMVTSGAAAGWLLSAAAALAGTDRGAIAQLPDVGDRPAEILIHRKHRGNFDHALRASGARLVSFGYSRDRTEEWELEKAIGDRTVAVAYVTDFGDDTVLSLATTVELAHRAGLPVLVDAACSVPPASNLTELVATGADLVAFSGGKALGGPQASGFVIGRRDLVEACLANTNPNHNTVGRTMKVSAEHMIGVLTALEEYLDRDHAAEEARWVADLERLRERVSDLVPVATIVPNRWPPVLPTLCIRGLADADAVVAALAAGDPSVRVGLEHGEIVVNLHAVAVDDVALLGDRLVEALEGRG